MHCAFSVPCHHLDPPFCCVARCTLHAQDGCFGIERASTGSGACAESARWVTADSAVSMTMARAPMLLEGVHQHPPVLLTRDERTDPTWSSPWLRLCSFERGLVLIGGKPRRRECLFACTRPSQSLLPSRPGNGSWRSFPAWFTPHCQRCSVLEAREG